MRDDVLFAEPLLERRRDALDQPPRVDEYDRRAMIHDELCDPIVDPPELLVARDRGELVVGDLDREIERPAMARIDNVRQRSPRTDQQPRDPFDRPLRRRQADPYRRVPGGVK